MPLHLKPQYLSETKKILRRNEMYRKVLTLKSHPKHSYKGPIPTLLTSLNGEIFNKNTGHFKHYVIAFSVYK